MAKKPETQTAEQQAKALRAPDEVLAENIRNVWEKYQRNITAVLLAAAVILVATALYRNHVMTETEDGWTALAESYAAADVIEARRKCEQYVNTGGGTRATPWVKLRLLQIQLAMSDSEAALKTSGELMAAYRGKPVAEIAQPLHAAALEGAKRYVEAAESFEALAARSSGKMAARFFWDAGRNREAAAAVALGQDQKDVAEKQVELARKAYEQADRNEPSNVVRELAAGRLTQLAAGGRPRMMPATVLPPAPEQKIESETPVPAPHAPIPGSE
ncbi:MAG TPA: hypothetical protein PL033_19435 [Candidatus Brocadiia bacterium]|nr:hypothetical protein [Candidatus Brocadiia bacterium]